MQAAIIVAVVAFSSSSLATIAIYTNNLTASIFCVVALAIAVYLALRFFLALLINSHPPFGHGS